MVKITGKTVLVVDDDDATTRQALALALEEGDYSVIGVANGYEVLLHLQQKPPPALILLDLMMPVMSGWEFRKKQKIGR